MQKLVKNKKKYIAYVAAHSGGHIIPAITHAHNQINNNTIDNALFFTSGKPLDVQLLRRYKQDAVKPLFLPLAKSPVTMPDYFMFGIQLIGSFLISLWSLLWYRPEKIISMGGLLSIPVCLAGKLLGIPYELYELNVEPGKAIKLLSQWAQQVHACFDETSRLLPDASCVKTDYPLRYATHHTTIDKKTVLNAFKFSPTRKTVLVIGGSQGSIFINQLIKNWLSQNPEHAQEIQIIHQTGNKDPFDYHAWYESQAIPAVVFQYADDLAPYYQVADYMIGRAGAGTIAEIQFFHIKSLLIPLTTKATHHQVANAQAAHAHWPVLFQWAPQKQYEKLYPHIQHLISSQKALTLN